MQLIYKGKSTRSLSKRVNFSDGFDLTFTENHSSNEEKCIQHIEEIVVPYIELKWKELGLNTENVQNVLCFSNVFKGQKMININQF